MLGGLFGWFSGLSLLGRVGVGIASVGTLGVVSNISAPSPAPLAPPPATEPKVEVKTDVVTESIPFEKTTVQDNSLEKGKTVLRTVGVNGTKTLTYEITFTDGVQTDKKLVKEETTTPPVTEVTALGTKVAAVAPPPRNNCDPNYTPCVPNVTYDLDCPDIGFMVRVIGTDRHRFDRDNDGYGCESYN